MPTVASGANFALDHRRMEEQEVGRVGKLAHGPLRDRCPRAAPNPLLLIIESAAKPLNGPIAPPNGVRGLWYRSATKPAFLVSYL
jgi:hypothetical protein